MAAWGEAEGVPMPVGPPRNGATPNDADEPCRILVVEADAGMLAALAVALGPAVDLDQAATLADVLERIVDAPPHLVILNAAIPELDANSVIKALRAQRADGLVLVIADQPHVRRIAELAALPLEGLLWKPVSVTKLVDRATSLLRSRFRHRFSARPLRVTGAVSQCLDHIISHYADGLTLRSIGNTVGVSVSHLAYRFRVETGMTVKAYVTAIRIAMARHLLAKTELKLEAIAELVGFCDASHLSRVFREASGVRPGAFRRCAAGRRHAPLVHVVNPVPSSAGGLRSF